MDVLKGMTPKELKKVSKVTIENKFGKVTFLNSISLYKKNFEDCIEIDQDSIEFKDDEWNNSKVMMVFRDFGGYKEKKSKVSDKVKL